MHLMKIEYKTGHQVRWQALMDMITTWDRPAREGVLLAATKYRSGEDSCNSVYMGGMGHTSLRQALGDSYPNKHSYEELVAIVSDKILNKGIMTAMHTIEYMLANPRRTCPCCGQITGDKK